MVGGGVEGSSSVNLSKTCWVAVEDTNLHGYKDGSHVGVDVCRESGRGSCYD